MCIEAHRVYAEPIMLVLAARISVYLVRLRLMYREEPEVSITILGDADTMERREKHH